jgi:hypothetical protein
MLYVCITIIDTIILTNYTNNAYTPILFYEMTPLRGVMHAKNLARLKEASNNEGLLDLVFDWYDCVLYTVLLCILPPLSIVYSIV